LYEGHRFSLLPCFLKGVLANLGACGCAFGVPPTGLRLSIESCTVERVSEGKIREHWRVSDTLNMMQQLGAIPKPQPA